MFTNDRLSNGESREDGRGSIGNACNRVRDVFSFAIGAHTVLTCLTEVRVVGRSRLPRPARLLDRWTVESIISLTYLVVDIDKNLVRKKWQ